MIAEALLVGAGFVGYLWLATRQAARRIEMELGSDPTPPKLPPYRTPGDPGAPDTPTQATGPLSVCPRCNAVAVQCPKCIREHRTDVAPFSECRGTGCIGQYTSKDALLAFTRSTGPTRYCQNHWWRPFCTDAPGIIHVHQRCQRCGWRGVAEIPNTHPEKS